MYNSNHTKNNPFFKNLYQDCQYSSSTKDTVKPNNLSSNPQTHMVKETDSLKLPFKQVCITYNIF